MKVRKYSKRNIGVIVAAAGLILIMAQPASAGKRDIWPHQLKPYSGGNMGISTLSEALAATRQTFNWVSATNTSSARLMAPVKMPAGKEITSLSINAYSAVVTTVEVILYRSKLGGPLEKVADMIKTGSYVPDWYSTNSIELPLIRKNYKYWVEVYIENGGVILNGIRIRYQ